MFRTHLRRSPRRTPAALRKGAVAAPSSTVLRHGRCIALVDARFLSWLVHGSEERAASAPLAPSAGLLRLLARGLRQAALEVDVLRAYWYTDQAPAAPVDDVVVRLVAEPDADGGQSLLRAMGHDLLQLARHQAVEHVLLVSDDERLATALEEAQLHGLSVHVAADEVVSDLARLKRDDPSWARLLTMADRRVQLELSDEALGTGADSADDDPAALTERIRGHIQAWWAEEDETQRLDLQDELRHLPVGLPQEVDRQLLLRMSRALGHTLSWPEKKIMRQLVRELALAEDTAAAPAEPAATADAAGGASHAAAAEPSPAAAGAASGPGL